MFKLITFDMYSAFLDIEGSALPLVEKALGLPRDESLAFFRLWRAKQWDYVLLTNILQRGFLSYEKITRTTLDYACRKQGRSLTPDQKEALMPVWTSFTAWPEAAEVVAALREKGYIIGMLSNGDEGMLRALEDSTGVRFDHIFAADHAQRYKPHPAIYNLPCEKLGIGKGDFLHVAGSLFDMMGAVAAGCRCAWSNRFGEYALDADYKPEFETRGLRELVDLL